MKRLGPVVVGLYVLTTPLPAYATNELAGLAPLYACGAVCEGAYEIGEAVLRSIQRERRERELLDLNLRRARERRERSLRGARARNRRERKRLERRFRNRLFRR